MEKVPLEEFTLNRKQLIHKEPPLLSFSTMPKLRILDNIENSSDSRAIAINLTSA